MKIFFITNRLTHHQVPICNELYRYDKSFRLIVCEKIPKHKENAYPSIDEYKDFVIEAYDEDVRTYIKEEILSADVVIIGSAPDMFIVNRLRHKKLTFKYSERLYKAKFTMKQWIKAYIGTIYHYIRFRNHPFYILCASAYTAADLNKFFNFKNRAFKWGYFPETKEYDVDTLLGEKKDNSILWVGRLIDWKHPEMPVYLAKKLKDDGYDFELNIIGTGDMDEDIKALIEQENLCKNVHLLGSMKPEEVRRYMEESKVFISTSDRQEGWGAVVNEAMNSGCCVVANSAVGSAPYLIKDGENGFLYEDGNLESLCKKVKSLLDNPDMCKDLGGKAYRTITDTWNAKVAAERVIELSRALLNKKSSDNLYTDGPCSKAPIIKDDWYR